MQEAYHEAIHHEATRKQSLTGSAGPISDLHKTEMLTSFYFLSLVEHKIYKSGKITLSCLLYQNVKNRFFYEFQLASQESEPQNVRYKKVSQVQSLTLFLEYVYVDIDP